MHKYLKSVLNFLGIVDYQIIRAQGTNLLAKAAVLDKTKQKALEASVRQSVLHSRCEEVHPSFDIGNRLLGKSSNPLSQTFLVLQNGCAYRARLLGLLAEDGIIPDKVMSFGSIETIIGCVKAGLGIAVMPRSFVIEAVQQGRVRSHELQGRDTRVPTIFIWRKDILMTPALSAFITEMRKSFNPLALTV